MISCLRPKIISDYVANFEEWECTDFHKEQFQLPTRSQFLQMTNNEEPKMFLLFTRHT